MICAEIDTKFGSLRAFTEQLRLRLLFKPLGYAADLASLRARCDKETADLSSIQTFLTPPATADWPPPPSAGP